MKNYLVRVYSDYESFFTVLYAADYAEAAILADTLAEAITGAERYYANDPPVSLEYSAHVLQEL